MNLEIKSLLKEIQEKLAKVLYLIEIEQEIKGKCPDCNGNHFEEIPVNVDGVYLVHPVCQDCGYVSN